MRRHVKQTRNLWCWLLHVRCCMRLAGKPAGAKLRGLVVVAHIGQQLGSWWMRFATAASPSSLPSALQSHIGPDKEDLDITEDGWLASRCFGEHGAMAARAEGAARALDRSYPVRRRRPQLARGTPGVRGVTSLHHPLPPPRSGTSARCPPETVVRQAGADAPCASAGYCVDHLAMCVCGQNSTYRHIPAPPGSPPWTPPVQHGRPLGDRWARVELGCGAPVHGSRMW